MKIANVRFNVTEWRKVRAEEHHGETGTSIWQVFVAGNIRVRMIEFSAGYRGNHWCTRGHVCLVLEGELKVDIVNGEQYTLLSGMSFQVGEDEARPHLVSTERGAKVFIVD